jgi:hypothetical protein
VSAGNAGRSGILGAVADYLIEPLEPGHGRSAAARTSSLRLVVAVIGLAPRCGTTTVARALGAELALRDPGTAAVVTADAVPGGGIPLGTAAAARLSRALLRASPVRARPVGRLCLTACKAEETAALVDTARPLAPLVLDVAEPSQAALTASLADAVVLVGVESAQPALAAVLAASLGRVGPAPVVVLNRDPGDAARWEGRCAHALPESRMGAQLALAGREPRGDLGRAVTQLAELVGA